MIRPLVQPLVFNEVSRHSGLVFAVEDGPDRGRGPPVRRQQGGVDIDHPQPGEPLSAAAEPLGKGGHDDQIQPQALEISHESRLVYVLALKKGPACFLNGLRKAAAGIVGEGRNRSSRRRHSRHGNRGKPRQGREGTVPVPGHPE